MLFDILFCVLFSISCLAIWFVAGVIQHVWWTTHFKLHKGHFNDKNDKSEMFEIFMKIK